MALCWGSRTISFLTNRGLLLVAWLHLSGHKWLEQRRALPQGFQTQKPTEARQMSRKMCETIGRIHWRPGKNWRWHVPFSWGFWQILPTVVIQEWRLRIAQISRFSRKAKNSGFRWHSLKWKMILIWVSLISGKAKFFVMYVFLFFLFFFFCFSKWTKLLIIIKGQRDWGLNLLTGT